MKKKLIGALAGALVIAGGGAYEYKMPHRPPPPPKPQTVSIGSFTTNLAGGTHYIKVDISLVVVGRQVQQHIAQDKAALTDLVLASLRGQSVSEVNGSAGLVHVKGVIRKALVGQLPGVTVKKVLFTQFVVE